MRRFSLWPEQASSLAGSVDALFLFLLAVTAVFATLIAGCLLYFMVKYRRRSERETPPVVHGSLALEAAWTVVPLVIVMVAFFWGASLFAALRHPPADALAVNVVARQWMWKVQHLEGRREINELHVPVGRSVKLAMTSEDVIHSFYVPAFRTKQDVIPGRYTTLWFEATKPGTYHLFCAEYCGTLHAGMIGRVVAMEPAAFQAWLSGTEPGMPRDLPAAEAGQRLFADYGCPSCHVGGGSRGPELAGLLGSTVRLQDGRTLIADEAYVRESILDPRAKVVAGYEPVMPTFKGLASEEAIMQMIAYLKSLPARRAGER